ncbi:MULTISPECIES: hypothetical protein [Methylomonas]|uniref:Aspartate carbamoyltransferase n=2 Tax=Methylomonas TaxID=416 RepID=A0A126T8M0_9GAMM|nr:MULTISPECIES: hypothetical protein [Methylomonas]AMK78433.1 aspartate carbamoyltransferase [Methylomonas denitrificans]OAI04135.1 aspartate carbamoyltransferase [Methylomonas methanica]TCV87537.1 hypothetical protein EDE11_10238 [Methylomonas methanica]
MNKPSIVLAGLLIFSASALAVEHASPKPSNASVLPYSAEQTEQTFSKTVHGGVQHVVAKAADNVQVVKAIQSHLFKIAGDFRKGDFSVTERLHGADMPGLAQLKKAEPGDIRFDYKSLDNGAQIHYSSEYPKYVQALHEWFDAQASEHGATAIPGHNQHHLTPAE